MNLTRRYLLVFTTVAMLTVPLAFAQKASPAGTADVSLEGGTITINYSRPFMKGRKIMGGLVPYGRWWRTGADDGVKVPAGNYTLYSLPSETDWKLIINKQTGQWGTEYDEKQDLARVSLKKMALNSPIEEFTIEFVKKGPKTAELVLEWENTKLSVPVRVIR